LGLLLSASIPEAFGDKGLLFAGAYVAMQVGRSLFTTYAMTRVHRPNTLNFVRITAWLVVAGVFWIADEAGDEDDAGKPGEWQF
ncbi:low temperature requirement protein A, partial [Rhizobium ruizarguesonis]